MAPLSPHREQILSRVHTLIAAGGYNGLKEADIAAPAGRRKRLAEPEYSDKVALLRAFVAYQRELTDAWIAEVQAASSDPSAQLKRYIGEWAKSIGDARAPFCICALLAAELPILPEQAAADLRAGHRSEDLHGHHTGRDAVGTGLRRSVRVRDDRGGAAGALLKARKLSLQ